MIYCTDLVMAETEYRREQLTKLYGRRPSGRRPWRMRLTRAAHRMQLAGRALATPARPREVQPIRRL